MSFKKVTTSSPVLWPLKNKAFLGSSITLGSFFLRARSERVGVFGRARFLPMVMALVSFLGEGLDDVTRSRSILWSEFYKTQRNAWKWNIMEEGVSANFNQRKVSSVFIMVRGPYKVLIKSPLQEKSHDHVELDLQ